MKNKTNLQLLELARLLRKASRDNGAPIWVTISRAISKPRKNIAQVNIRRISRFTKNGETVAVLGKVLGTGVVDHKVTVAALGFSNSAKEKIRIAGGKCFTFLELLESNPKGTHVKIMR
jgi:large subunit ribosomal protein L18e